MESEGSEKETIVSQISVGGFGNDVTAKELADYLDDKIGLVWRCRLKTSCTPPESYPNFELNLESDKIRRKKNLETVEPHAFVHFALPESSYKALDAAGRNDLILCDKFLKVSLGQENAYRINQRRRKTTPHKFENVSIDIGNLVWKDELVVSWRGPSIGVDFLVDPFDGSCKFVFAKDTAFSFKGRVECAVIKCDFKIEFSVRDINEVKEFSDTKSLVILLQLASAPKISYRTADDDIEESVPFDLLDDDDPWIRTTDFTPGGAIGRCNSYKVSIPVRYGLKLKRAMDFLRERRVPTTSHAKLRLRVQEEPDFGMPMSDSFFCIHFSKGISFEILFLVNTIMHKGILNQHQLSENFFDLLRSQPAEVNIAALRHICSYRRPLFDASKRLKLVQDWLLKNPKLLKCPRSSVDIVEVRRLVITPTKAYCLPPEVELSNRVLRNFKDVADRFLRVTFMDEGMQTMNNNLLNCYAAPIVKTLKPSSHGQKTAVFRRVKAILFDGFYLCGRKYSFLAFSSNQLRDRSAWFFSEDAELSVKRVKGWMGKFENRNIAKCAARMGQCFSSTYATVEVPTNQTDSNLPDIKRNKYNFSDGIGTITPDLAKEVATKLNLEMEAPCAYQIRYAGCKGVVACWPAKDDRIRLSLRPSMNKFISNHTMLEVCSWTRFQPGFLNRQIITLLTALGVADEIFQKMQNAMLSNLNHMLADADVAFDVLMASCADQGNTAAMMLSAGFRPQTEPHLRGMLTCVRAAQLWGLREKARIFVPSGRWLMGCLDELGVLDQGQCFVQVSNPMLENCFSKHGSRFSERKNNLHVVKGFVVVAKNPCLHPGDVRILEAVDAPDLHHLSDCLVFPQKGDRPHTNEASGSDLDGDLYFVTWEENLIPASKTSWPPMEYDTGEAKELPRDVNQQDIIDFFTRNMVNENLGAICNAHVVHADMSEYGAHDEKCIILAQLAATAVDFPKTGKIVTMPSHLKPKLYPDFMGKEPFQSYQSKKILGRLYRQIKDAYDEDASPSSEIKLHPVDIPYDKDLEVHGSADFVDDAWNQKCSYDGQLSGLLGQYKVQREEEIVTGHVWSMPKYTSKKQGDLKERLKHAYSSLRREFRHKFEEISSDFEHLNDDAKNKIYEQKASAWYQVTYHPEWVKKSLELRGPDNAGEQLLLSFAWITTDYLVRVKIRSKGLRHTDSGKPVDSLAKYLAALDVTST